MQETPAERTLLCRLWLTYYNTCLYKAGLITRAERERMAGMIRGYTPPGK